MDRSELFEVASQYLDRVIILLTVAGEDRLAHDIEEWVDCVEFRLAHDIEEWVDCVEFFSASSGPKRARADN
jgi:hypothetical protein